MLGRRLPCAILLAIAGGTLFFASSIAFSTPIVSGSAIRDFLGGHSGKYAYTQFQGTDGYKANGNPLYYVDFSEDSLVERQVVQTDEGEARNAIISPDGKWVTYNVRHLGSGWGDATWNKCYIAELKENSTPIYICDGAQPHWWIKPGTSELYIICVNGDLEDAWQNTWPPNAHNATTYSIRVTSATMQPSGSRQTLDRKSTRLNSSHH
jgi:hypothetical protein